MPHILTLIGESGAAVVSNNLAREVAARLPGAGKPRWLAPNEACDIPFALRSSADLPALEHDVRNAIGDAPLDIAIVPSQNRRKKLLVADMDSTIIQQECIDELGDFVGLKAEVAAITERAMRGELEFEAALRERVGLLAGLDESVLERVVAERIILMPGAKTLVRTMKQNGAFCALVSGGFTFFTGRIAAMTGFDINQANVLEASSGKLTGKVAEPILGQDAKLRALRKFRDAKDLSNLDILAVGDGANDLAMISEAGLGVAYRSKPVVAAQADVRIDHGDLTALLFLQGYAKAGFADG